MASISKRRTSKGEARYDVRWRANGRPVEKAFKKRADAEAFKRNVEAEEMRGVVIDPRRGRLTVAEMAAEWLASNPSKRGSTYARDEIAIRCHIIPAIGSRRLAGLTPAEVQVLVNLWSGQRSPRSVARDYGVLRAILAFAVERDHLARTPCRTIHLPAAGEREVRLVTGDDLEALSAAMGRYGLMAHLGAQLGLRWGEVAGLRVGRIDLLSGTVVVAEQVTRGQAGKPSLGPPKSAAGRRVVSVGPWLLEALTAHMRSLGLLTDLSAFVFPADSGGPLDYPNWRRRVWLPATKRVGLDGLGFHDLRRACATYMVLDGLDPKTAQGRLGHSDPRLTLAIYAQATPEGDRRAAAMLAGRFDPGR
jgi:integrase